MLAQEAKAGGPSPEPLVFTSVQSSAHNVKAPWNRWLDVSMLAAKASLFPAVDKTFELRPNPDVVPPPSVELSVVTHTLYLRVFLPDEVMRLLYLISFCV